MLVLNVNFNEETLPLCSESKYLGKSSESHVSPTLQATSQKLTSNLLTLEVDCWLWLGQQRCEQPP